MTFNAILFTILICATIAAFCLGFLIGQWKYRNYILKMLDAMVPVLPEPKKKNGDDGNGDH